MSRAGGPRLVWSVLALAFAMGLFAFTGRAEAQTRRYAVLIGSNEGHADEERLRFAEDDARRLAGVLRRLGGFSDSDLILVEGADADRAKKVLSQVARRIELETAPGDDVLFFVYYSGHADNNAMHLGTSDLTFSKVKRLINATPAKLRVLVLDACRSGEVIRTRGGVPAENFEFKAENNLETEGLAIIASSAAGEDAQESDRLGGGIFTHHFVNGLAGAADATTDGKITLTEAYNYAYDQTLKSTSTARFVQHPTYSFALAGREEVTLTSLVDDRDLGRLVLDSPGSYVVFRNERRGEVAAELSASEGTTILLEPGTYLVRRRGAKTAYEARARLSAGKITRLDTDAMDTVPYGVTVRRGGSRRGAAGALTASFEAAGPFLLDLGPGYAPSLGLKLDLRQLTLLPRLRYSYSRSRQTSGAALEPDPIDVTQHVAGVDLAVLKLFDARRFSPGIGVRVGGDLVWQSFRTDGFAPPRRSVVGRFGPLLRLEYSPAARLLLSVELGADIVLLRGDEGVGAGVSPYGGLGMGVYMF